MSRRAGFTDSALVRLLARLNGADVREPAQSTADRLSEWLGWTEAITLSGVLISGGVGARSGATAASAKSPALAAPTAIDREVAECTRVRAALQQTFVGNNALTSDVALYRQRYLARQQAMGTAIGPLRSRLRGQLAARSPAMAKLAAVDAVMDQALAPKAQRLLATIPGLLEKHFKQLQKTSQATAARNLREVHERHEVHEGPEAPGSDAGEQADAWLEVFRNDFHDVLMAELDFRFQPVDGLLEALRTKQPTD